MSQQIVFGGFEAREQGLNPLGWLKRSVQLRDRCCRQRGEARHVISIAETTGFFRSRQCLFQA